MKSITRRANLRIVFEDKRIIVVDKPAGLLTIADNKTDPRNCLYHQVYEHVNRSTGQRIFIVHRLDKDTSGLLIFAKDAEAKIFLQKQFEEQNVIRSYEAVVSGEIKKKKDRIKLHLFTDRFNNVFVGKKGELAVTDYEVISSEKERTLVDIRLLTGKRNQIRASFDYIGHPIIGDKKYHGLKNSRLLLNAYSLSFLSEGFISEEFSFTIPKIFKL